MRPQPLISVIDVEASRRAKRAGADHVILYRERDFAAEVREITLGEGVAAAYDEIGRHTFSGSLESLGYGGLLVNHGQASGSVEPFSPKVLAARSGQRIQVNVLTG